MGRDSVAAKARRQAAAAAAAGQGAVTEPAVAAQPVAPAPTPETGRGIFSASPVAGRILAEENIRLSDEDRKIIAMDDTEAMRNLTGVYRNPYSSIAAMTGRVPVVLRAGENGKGPPIAVLIRTRFQGKDGINKTLVTITPRDEYRLVHYTRRGREVSRQEGLRGDEVAQYYRDATGIALSLR